MRHQQSRTIILCLEGITGTGKFVTVLFPTLVHAAHDVVYKQVLRV